MVMKTKKYQGVTVHFNELEEFDYCVSFIDHDLGFYDNGIDSKISDVYYCSGFVYKCHGDSNFYVMDVSTVWVHDTLESAFDYCSKMDK